MCSLGGVASHANLALQSKRHPDIHVKSSVLGMVTAIRQDGSLVVQRTANGAGGSCTVALYGIRLPQNKQNRMRLTSFLAKHYLHREVRFNVFRVEKKRYSAMVNLTVERVDSSVNATVVAQGLADTALPNEPYFKYALQAAKDNRRGIWRNRSR
jgi:endonuclease YncB( thermonuclease family)